MWFMDGETIVDGVSDNHPGVGVWQIVGAGYIDDDNKSDIVWEHVDTGEIFVWLIDGSTTPVGSGSLGFPDARFRNNALGLADLDGSGTDDIVFQASDDDALAVFFTDGLNTVTAFEIGPPPANFEVAAFGNVNGAEADDIIFEDATGGNYGIWEFDETGNIATGCGQSHPGVSTFQLAGSGNLNPADDDTDDFVWENFTANSFVGWTIIGCSNGGIPTTFGDMGPVDARFGYSGTGDFNGDDNVDLLFTDSSEVLALTLFTGFTPSPFEVGPAPDDFKVATNGQLLP
jgi:hypothetical protein